MSATELLVWGVVIHLIVDWLGQNEWIALNKTRLRHPVTDTRRPLELWGRVMSQPTKGPEAFTIHVWRDQALHVAAIAATALIVGD